MVNNNLEKEILNIENMTERIKKMKYVLSKMYVYGESGAGLVKVKMNGEKNLVKLKIDRSIMKEDKLVLENLIIKAINIANKKADIEINSEIVKTMKEIGIPKKFISMFPLIGSN